MKNINNKIFFQLSFFIVAILLNIWGLLSISYVNEWINIGVLAYLDRINYILIKYVIIVATMTAGILTFSITAQTLTGKLLKGLVVGITIYAVVLTIPLLLSFILFMVSSSGIELPLWLSEMVDPIAHDFVSFKKEALINIVYIAGIIMSVIFLVFPMYLLK